MVVSIVLFDLPALSVFSCLFSTCGAALPLEQTKKKNMLIALQPESMFMVSNFVSACDARCGGGLESFTTDQKALQMSSEESI